MATPAPTTIPTEPIGSIPRALDLIKRVARVNSANPNLAPFYEEARKVDQRVFVEVTAPVDPHTWDAGRSARPFVRTRQELAMVPGRRLIFN